MIRRLILAAAFSVVLVLGTSAAAEAAYVWSNTGGAYVRAQPWQSSAAYAYVGNYTVLAMYCWTDSGWAMGNWWTNRWYQVAVPGWRYGGVGYIHASLVANPPALRRC